jgi:ferrous iron transport protein A
MTDVALGAFAPQMEIASRAPSTRRLGDMAKGDRGIITHVGPAVGHDHGHDLERRLLELGFVEGAEVELLHEGTFGRDPIAVRIHGTRLALRRREAASVLVALQG